MILKILRTKKIFSQAGFRIESTFFKNSLQFVGKQEFIPFSLLCYL